MVGQQPVAVVANVEKAMKRKHLSIQEDELDGIIFLRIH